MSNALSTIAEGVKTLLADATLSQSFTVDRAYAFPLQRETLDGIKIVVAGGAEKIDLFGTNTTRAYCEHQYTVSVGIYAPATFDDLSGLDALSDFRQEVIDLIKSNRTVGGASLIDVSNAPVYDPTTLEKEGVYLSVITIVYRLLR